MSTLAHLAVVLLVPMLASCGGVVGSSASPGTGGSGLTGNGPGGSGSSGGNGPGGSGSSGGNGPGGSESRGGNGPGGSATCASYEDEGGPPVRVSILNKTNALIYLGAEQATCGSAPLFWVADANGAAVVDLAGCPSLRFSCSAFQTPGSLLGCSNICFYPSSVALQPGELKMTSWDGLYSVQRDMPEVCAATDSGFETVSCDQAKRIQPGSYTFSARAGSTLDCSQTTGTATCPKCMPNADGGCSTPGGVIGGSILTATSTVALDAKYGVSASSADSSPGSAGAGPIETLTVELVFTN